MSRGLGVGETVMESLEWWGGASSALEKTINVLVIFVIWREYIDIGEVERTHRC